jgi:hypothetical protein
LKNGYINIKNIIIALLIAVIIVKTRVIETIEYDTVYQSTPKYIPVPGPVVHDTTYIPRDIDTAFILKDYFALYPYSDTIHFDSLDIVIKDTVTQNKIKSRVLEYELLYPTKTVTIIKDRYLNRREFYVGPAISGATDGFKFVGIESIYRSKKNTTFKVNAGINENLGVQVGLGLHWKIKFR